MRFLCVGLNYHPEPTGIAVYTSGLCNALSQRGNAVHVVTASPYYPHWKTFPGYRKTLWQMSEEEGVKVLRCPIYVPSRITGLTRILHYISFLLSSFIPVFWIAFRKKPDVVINVAPTLISSLSGLLAAKACGAKSLIHIQDFEVEAGLATDQLVKGSVAARIAINFSDFVIRAHDLATTISPAMVRKLKGKRAQPHRTFELRNWADIAVVSPNDFSIYREYWNVKTPYVALYSGSIARKQGLETFVEAARILDIRDDITMIMCGNGPYRSDLERSATGINCIRFYDLQPKDRLGELLNLATLHVLPQKRGAADLVLPSKLTNMLASGRPLIVGADPGTGLAEEVAKCGVIVEPENAQELATAIGQLVDDSEKRRRLGNAARHRAETAWAQDMIIKKFVLWLEANV